MESGHLNGSVASKKVNKVESGNLNLNDHSFASKADSIID